MKYYSYSEQKKKKFKHFMLYIAAISLGLLAGYANIPLLKPLGLLIAEIFIRIFKCLSLPLIALSIIVTLANFHTEKMLQRVWRYALRYTFGTTLVAAIVSCLLYLLIQPQLIEVPKPHSLPATGAEQFNYLNYLMQIVPSNPLSPFLENQVLGVILLSFVIGIATCCIPEKDAKDTLIQFFNSLHRLLMVITHWIIRFIPIGLFGFITVTAAKFQGGVVFGGLGEYLSVIILANLIQGLIILPLWLKFHGVAPFTAFRNMLPALQVAFFCKSSVATLPITIRASEEKLSIHPNISRFVLPLCTSLNMNGCAAFIFVTVTYLMQNHGIHIGLTTMGLWILIATLAAIGNAGVPMGCFFLSASLLTSMNVPIALMGIILPFYTLIDMLETALNVWSDICVTKVVNDQVTKDIGLQKP